MKNIEVIQEKLSTWWNIIVSLVPNIVLLIVFVIVFSFLSKYLIRIITKILYRIFPENANKNTPLLFGQICQIYSLCFRNLHRLRNYASRQFHGEIHRQFRNCRCNCWSCIKRCSFWNFRRRSCKF